LLDSIPPSKQSAAQEPTASEPTEAPSTAVTEVDPVTAVDAPEPKKEPASASVASNVTSDNAPRSSDSRTVHGFAPPGKISTLEKAKEPVDHIDAAIQKAERERVEESEKKKNAETQPEIPPVVAPAVVMPPSVMQPDASFSSRLASWLSDVAIPLLVSVMLVVTTAFVVAYFMQKQHTDEKIEELTKELARARAAAAAATAAPPPRIVPAPPAAATAAPHPAAPTATASEAPKPARPAPVRPRKPVPPPETDDLGGSL
jgi:hypothetical protein